MSFESGMSGTSVSGAQMQARFEAAQSERIMAATQQAAGRANKGNGTPKTEAEKIAAEKKLVKVSKDFESIFLGYLLKTMRDAVPKSDYFGHSREAEIFGSMRDEEMAKDMAQAGGIGLADMMVKQLKKTME